MNAGRELDASVAEKVMGWTGVKQVTVFGVARWEGLPPDYAGYTYAVARKALVSLPEYSTDILSAWKVVEKINLLDDNDLWHAAEGWCIGDKESYLYDSRPETCAETAPLAICLAALKAVGALHD